MAEESDGVNEAIEGNLRIAVTMATRAAETLARVMADRARQAQAVAEAESSQLHGRLAVERYAPGAAPTGTQRQPGGLEAERDRAGTDVGMRAPEPVALDKRAAEQEGAREEGQHQRAGAKREAGKAVALMAEADLAERGQQPERGAASQERAEVAYDSAARREGLAARLETIADPETVQAVMLADIAQARPASAAVQAPTTVQGRARAMPAPRGRAAQMAKTFPR